MQVALLSQPVREARRKVEPLLWPFCWSQFHNQRSKLVVLAFSPKPYGSTCKQSYTSVFWSFLAKLVRQAKPKIDILSLLPKPCSLTGKGKRFCSGSFAEASSTGKARTSRNQIPFHGLHSVREVLFCKSSFRWGGGVCGGVRGCLDNHVSCGPGISRSV